MTRPTGGRANWLAIRTLYLSDPNQSYPTVAKRFGVSTRSVEMRASKEGWVDERKRVFGDAERQLRVDVGGNALAILTLHAGISDRILQAVELALNELAGMAPGRSKAETIKTLAEAADKSIRLGRDVRGIKTGEPSTIDEVEDGNHVRIVREVVAAPPAEVESA